MDLVGVLSYLGAMALLLAAVTGAYVWCRWGYIGVLAIWSVRKTLDQEVCTSIQKAVAESVRKESASV